MRHSGVVLTSGTWACAQVRYELLGQMLSTRDLRRQLAASLVLNWIVGPLLMTGLAWATLPDLPNYRNGVIMVTCPSPRLFVKGRSALEGNPRIHLREEHVGPHI